MKPTKQQLQRINAMLPGTVLSADSVECLPFMTFDNKVTDRYTIMSKEMMRKLERDFNDGKAAFTALHASRTSLSFGRSFSGRIIEKEEQGLTELHAMMYAVLKTPDGQEFKEGKDIADRYNTGAVQACSVGVQVGFYKCTICGHDIRDWSNCEHFPGKSYVVDEQAKKCYAIMTGHKIVDGVAEDCLVYEVSAVTAGGVANAGVRTEAFGKYQEGVDPKDIKKDAIEKGIDMRVEFTAARVEEQSNESERSTSMEKHEIEAMLQAHYSPLKAEKDKLQDDYDILKTEKADLQGKFETLQTEAVASQTELVELQGKYTALEVKVTELETKHVDEGFETAYRAIVFANGVKAGETLNEDEFAKKTLEELQALQTEYVAKIAALPAGRQSTDQTQEVSNDYSGIPDNAFSA